VGTKTTEQNTFARQNRLRIAQRLQNTLLALLPFISHAKGPPHLGSTLLWSQSAEKHKKADEDMKTKRSLIRQLSYLIFTCTKMIQNN
jgi:hypothetical protein